MLAAWTTAVAPKIANVLVCLQIALQFVRFTFSAHVKSLIQSFNHPIWFILCASSLSLSIAASFHHFSCCDSLAFCSSLGPTRLIPITWIEQRTTRLNLCYDGSDRLCSVTFSANRKYQKSGRTVAAETFSAIAPQTTTAVPSETRANEHETTSHSRGLFDL